MKKTRNLLHIWNKPPNFASQIPGGGVRFTKQAIAQMLQ